MTVDFEELSYRETPFGELALPGGVFGLWSNDPPDADFQAELDRVFEASEACVVKFPNPLLGREAACTVYLGMSSAPSTMSGRI